MKNFIFIASVATCLLIMSIVGFSCIKEKTNAHEEPTELSYEDVGVLHNEGLDYVLDYLKATVLHRKGLPVPEHPLVK